MASSRVGYSAGVCDAFAVIGTSAVVLGTMALDLVFMTIKMYLYKDNNSHLSDIKSNWALIPNMM